MGKNKKISKTKNVFKVDSKRSLKAKGQLKKNIGTKVSIYLVYSIIIFFYFLNLSV